MAGPDKRLRSSAAVAVEGLHFRHFDFCRWRIGSLYQKPFAAQESLAQSLALFGGPKLGA